MVYPVKIHVENQDGLVIMTFSKLPSSSVSMCIDQTRDFANMLLKHANIAERNNPENLVLAEVTDSE